MLDVCMFTLGGQHSYIRALCSGLAEVGPAQGGRTCLVTGPGPAPTGSPSYYVETILPRQIPVQDYKSRLHWLCSRLIYLRRRRPIPARFYRPFGAAATRRPAGRSGTRGMGLLCRLALPPGRPPR